MVRTCCTSKTTPAVLEVQLPSWVESVDEVDVGDLLPGAGGAGHGRDHRRVVGAERLLAHAVGQVDGGGGAPAVVGAVDPVHDERRGAGLGGRAGRRQAERRGVAQVAVEGSAQLVLARGELVAVGDEEAGLRLLVGGGAEGLEGERLRRLGRRHAAAQHGEEEGGQRQRTASRHRSAHQHRLLLVSVAARARPARAPAALWGEVKTSNADLRWVQRAGDGAGRRRRGAGPAAPAPV